MTLSVVSAVLYRRSGFVKKKNKNLVELIFKSGIVNFSMICASGSAQVDNAIDSITKDS